LRQADESREIQLSAYQEGVAELTTLIEAQRRGLKFAQLLPRNF
jgi:hypothetical protein